MKIIIDSLEELDALVRRMVDVPIPYSPTNSGRMWSRVERIKPAFFDEVDGPEQPEAAPYPTTGEEEQEQPYEAAPDEAAPDEAAPDEAAPDEPEEDPEQPDVGNVEAKLKPVRKPRGVARPDRATPDEKPGDCVTCVFADKDSNGWFCSEKMQELSADAKTCTNIQLKAYKRTEAQSDVPRPEVGTWEVTEDESESETPKPDDPDACRPVASDPDAFFDAPAPPMDSKAVRAKLEKLAVQCLHAQATKEALHQTIRMLTPDGPHLISKIKDTDVPQAIVELEKALRPKS